jgi:hypothetical protein
MDVIIVLLFYILSDMHIYIYIFIYMVLEISEYIDISRII